VSLPALHDPVLALTMHERTFRTAVVAAATVAERTPASCSTNAAPRTFGSRTRRLIA
jgi:hypothetical protein